MVAKKIIIRLMEEFLGEYILNISPENLKVAVLRGKIKLENVQLDGDLIGSHVLSAVGLSGFAVLSCTAEKLRANIPWGKLEKEPTTFELSGLQLICVPLLPSNATRVFGSGTKVDPKCTLRTRVKKAALARFERNFFSWRIPGEGPRKPNNKKSRKKQSGQGRAWDDQSINTGIGTADTMEGKDESFSVSVISDNKEFSDAQRIAWREKLFNKLSRNIEISVRDMHIRCEVCEGALYTNGGRTADFDKSNPSPKPSPADLDADKRAFAFGVHVDSIVFKSANSNWQTGKNVDWKVDQKTHGEESEARKKEAPAEKLYKVLLCSQLALYWDDNPPLLLSECDILKFSSPHLSEHKVLTIIRTAMQKITSNQEPGDKIRQLLDTGESSTYKRTVRSQSVRPGRDHFYLLKQMDMEMRMGFTLFKDGRPNMCTAEIVPCRIDLSFSPIQLRQRRLLEYTMMGQQRLDTMLHQRPILRPTEDPRGWWKYVISCVITCPNRRPWRDIRAITAKREEYVALVEKKHLRKRLNKEERAVLLRLEDVLPIETLLVFHLLALRNVVSKRERALSPKRRSKFNQDDDLSSIGDAESVASARSTMRGLSRSPRNKRQVSRSRGASMTRKGEEIIATSHFDNMSLTRHPALPRSPLAKLVSARGGYSPPRDRAVMQTADDHASISPSVASQGTMNLEFTENESYFDFDGVFPPDDEEIEIKPPMAKTIRGHSVTITASLLDRHIGEPVLVANLQSSIWAQSSLSTGTSFLMDMKSMECFGYADEGLFKLFTFDLPSSDLRSADTDEEKMDDTSEVTTPLELPNSFDDGVDFLDTFCSQMLEEDMPLPPRGVVCRVLLDLSDSKRSISLSAYGATLIWNTICIRAFMNSFFPNQAQEARSILGTQLRNAATPLAHKAQVALISPRAMICNMNIDFPKIWIPVSQDTSDGALFINTGRLRMNLTKPEWVANMHGIIRSTGMYANFRQGKGAKNVFVIGNDLPRSDDISILLPFNYSIDVDRCGEGPAFVRRKDGVDYEQSRRVNMTVTAISLNLVDVEVLALAIGRWYATEMLALKNRREERSKLKQSDSNPNEDQLTHPDAKFLEEEIYLKLDSIELFLQGQATEKRKSGKSKRTYMIQVTKIEASHCNRGTSGTSDVDIGRISIIRESVNSSTPTFAASNELHHQFIKCKPTKSRSKETKDGESKSKSALNLNFIRDGETQSNEFDVTFGRIVFGFTPSILTDCSVAISRIVRSTKTITKEMERRVHLASRVSRISESRDESILHSPTGVTNASGVTNATGTTTALSSVVLNRYERDESMLMMKLSAKETVILVGWDQEDSSEVDTEKKKECEPVFQLSASVLLMYQSTETLDLLGKTIIHASFDKCWTSLVPEFSVLPLRKCEPIITPFAFEFRSVKSTANFGDIASQEFALDSDSIEVSIDRYSLSYVANMGRNFVDKCQSFAIIMAIDSPTTRIRDYKIRVSTATTIGFQLQPSSFTLLGTRYSNYSSEPLLNFKCEANGKVGGSLKALSGELKAESSLFYFSKNVNDWVYLMEPLHVSMELLYGPNDLVVNTNCDNALNINITSEMLELIAGELRHKSHGLSAKPPVKGVKKKKKIKIFNNSGINFFVAQMQSKLLDEKSDSESFEDQASLGKSKMLRSGSYERVLDLGDEACLGLMPVLTEEQEKTLCERAPILDVPLHPAKEIEILHLSPKVSNYSGNDGAEPVIEYCFQNQRLRSAFSDFSALENGTDLLSSQVWSTSDQIFTQGFGQWLHPYLDKDVPEWSDTTFTMTMDKDRTMLPDNKWMWANDWEVDLSGAFGKEVDADGWNYAKDFQKFGKVRHYFKDGDTCRRRRWIRTRVMKSHLADSIPLSIPVVWRIAKEDGCQCIRITSQIMVKNNVNRTLALLGYKCIWKDDKMIGNVKEGEEISIPLTLASITHLTIAILDETKDPSEQELHKSKRFMILPTSNSCKRLYRPKIYLDATNTVEELLSSRTVHFLVIMKHDNGLTEISIEPILKVQNLLPCPFQYRLLEAAKQVDSQNNFDLRNAEDMIRTEERNVEVDEEVSSITVDPSLNPSISFRVPGYQWSSYQRIVNRSQAESSWKPNKYDEIIQFELTAKNDNCVYTSLILLERIDDVEENLTILLEVSPGHCPTLRIYAQYWIVDVSGFGLRFCDGASDLLGTVLLESEFRKSYTKRKHNINTPGHQWTIGEEGMTMYFTEKLRIAFSVDLYKGDMSGKPERSVRSEWSNLLDISNLMPKTAFQIYEANSKRVYEFCYEVDNAPGLFGRTKIIKVHSRFHVINLSRSALYLTQQGCPNEISFVPPQGSIPFHLEDATLPVAIRLSTNCVNWSNGSLSLVKVGITSMKLHDSSEISPVLQVEVRLASNDQKGAVAVLIWNSEQESQPLYTLKNSSRQTIICWQQRQEEENDDDINGENDEYNILATTFGCGGAAQMNSVAELVSNSPCNYVSKEGGVIGNSSRWILRRGEEKHFGFDDPQKAHVLEWTVQVPGMTEKDTVDIDAIGSYRVIILQDGNEVGCVVRAEKSTKVIEFVDISCGLHKENDIVEIMQNKVYGNSISATTPGETEATLVCFAIKIFVPITEVSIIDTRHDSKAGREIFLLTVDSVMFQFAQSVERNHEIELKIAALQIDNHLHNSSHPVLVSFLHSKDEPIFHLSAIRRIQSHVSSTVYRYVAVRLLDVTIALDRRTVEEFVRYFEPLQTSHPMKGSDPKTWIVEYTDEIAEDYKSGGLSSTKYAINTNRLYIEELRLHPARISLTFTQNWYSGNATAQGPALLHYIRLVPSIANASLIFTSFVVSHAFESPTVLQDIIRTHYMSQMTSHMFSLIGSLAILTGPADFLANIGTGVRDFFYEPINGLVHGPAQFIEGLETGSLSLVRGVFVGVVRGAANVTGILNANLVHLTDTDFIEERISYQQNVSELTHGSKPKTIGDVLALAGASVAHGVRSGAAGLYEEPFENFNRQGTGGFVKGVGRALLSAIVKPIVGIGDGAILVMQHVTEESDEDPKSAAPKRIRRALPRKLNTQRNSVILIPFDGKSAMAQKLIAGNEKHDDAYIGHLYTERYLLIASDMYLWIVDRKTNERDCFQWYEISHFHNAGERIMHIIVFTRNGMRPNIIELDSSELLKQFNDILSNQNHKMTNATHKGTDNFISNATDYDLDGIKTKQSRHVFGSMNGEEILPKYSIEDEIQIVEECYNRVGLLCSNSSTFFSDLDDESWGLINAWRFMYSGLNSKHCLAAGFINGSDMEIQIKATTLHEGGSPCCHIPSKNYDEPNSILKPGSAVLFFAWGVPPSLDQEGRILLEVETNAFVCSFLDRNSPDTKAETIPGHNCECIFLEKSIATWWAKFWVLVK